MQDEYESLKKFIHCWMTGPKGNINHLDITRSAIKSITRRFEELGWSVEPIADENSRHSRHTVISPDGTERLSMIGGKVYRHPAYTEQICRRKHLTKRMLDLDSLPTPAGADFSPREKEIAAAFFEKMPKPVVVKPTDSGSSQGVTVGVYERAQFDIAWSHALDEGRSNSNVLVEQFVKGVELRAFVVGDDVVSVFARVQPFVLGDGSLQLNELIDNLHEARKVHYRAMKMPVVVDWDFVRLQGLDVASLPAPGQIVFLNPFCYPSMGAFLVDVTRDTCDEIKDVARRAKNCIPHLEVAGVDVLVEDLRDASTAYVLEVNTAASLDLHRYPTHGDPRAVDEDIVDYFHTQYPNRDAT